MDDEKAKDEEVETAGGTSPAVSPIPPSPALAVYTRSVRTSTSYSFEGPLPPPQVMDYYQRIYPDAARRLFDFAEREQLDRHARQAHDQEIDEHVVRSATFYELLGLIFAFVIGVVVIVGGIVLLVNDKDVAGYISLVAGLGALISLFIYGIRHGNQGNESPKEATAPDSTESTDGREQSAPPPASGPA